ncbi:MAG: hypothetical protein QG641_2612, partial [Candidatus Poribacteria bacterium]|nr:hypothetical protein [Candidatus Poribacteria bacterium]
MPDHVVASLSAESTAVNTEPSPFIRLLTSSA